MKIRQMKVEDLQTVSLIDELSFSQPWPPAAFESELLNRNARCWVAELDISADPAKVGPVVGALVIWRVLDEAHIATIAVHPDYRKQGIGKTILRTGMTAAYLEGARIFHLEVRAGNIAAQKMYQDFGYDSVGLRPKYYKNNGEDAVLMTLNLNVPTPDLRFFSDKV